MIAPSDFCATLPTGSRVIVSRRSVPIDRAEIADSPEAAARIWRKYVEAADWFDPSKEHVIVLGLARSGLFLGLNVVALGSSNECGFNVREVLRSCFAIDADSFLIGHNHPTGVLKISPDDVSATKRIFDAAAIVGIEFRDHLVFGNAGGFVSIREERPDLWPGEVLPQSSGIEFLGEAVRLVVSVPRKHTWNHRPEEFVAECSFIASCVTSAAWRAYFIAGGEVAQWVEDIHASSAKRRDCELVFHKKVYSQMERVASQLGRPVEDLVLALVVQADKNLRRKARKATAVSIVKGPW